MALLLEVEYPGGERAIATGYPGGALVVQIIPRGPEAALHDELECDFATGEPYRVLRIIAGPRRPTIHVRLGLDEAGTEQWMLAREADGWDTRDVDDEVWLVATRDDLDPATLGVPYW